LNAQPSHAYEANCQDYFEDFFGSEIAQRLKLNHGEFMIRLPSADASQNSVSTLTSLDAGQSYLLCIWLWRKTQAGAAIRIHHLNAGQYLRFEAQQLAGVGHFGIPTGGKVNTLPTVDLT
jgi:hypothetical protein